MNIVCYESPSIDSVYHVTTQTYTENHYFEFTGAPSINEHIIINDNCALISFEIDGKTYEYDGDLVCGKFTHVPKIKIIFKDTNKKLLIIRVTSCGLFSLTDMPVSSIVNSVLPGSIVNFEMEIENEHDRCIRFVDLDNEKICKDKSYCITHDIIRYVHDNFTHLPTNATKEIAQKFAISESSLRRYFKKYLGINLSTYIMTIKRKKMVKAIFEENYDSLIVRENGYYDQSHFLNDFKRIYGVPLKQYSKELRLMKKREPELMQFLYHCNIESNLE